MLKSLEAKLPPSLFGKGLQTPRSPQACPPEGFGEASAAYRAQRVGPTLPGLLIPALPRPHGVVAGRRR